MKPVNVYVPGDASACSVSADGVARALSSFIPGISLSKGYAIADTIHNTGQAIVWTGQKEIAELYWEQLRDAGLTMAPLEQG